MNTPNKVFLCGMIITLLINIPLAILVISIPCADGSEIVVEKGDWNGVIVDGGTETSDYVQFYNSGDMVIGTNFPDNTFSYTLSLSGIASKNYSCYIYVDWTDPGYNWLYDTESEIEFVSSNSMSTSVTHITVHVDIRGEYPANCKFTSLEVIGSYEPCTDSTTMSVLLVIGLLAICHFLSIVKILKRCMDPQYMSVEPQPENYQLADLHPAAYSSSINSHSDPQTPN